jgi:hypothetical protein
MSVDARHLNWRHNVIEPQYVQIRIETEYMQYIEWAVEHKWLSIFTELCLKIKETRVLAGRKQETAQLS